MLAMGLAIVGCGGSGSASSPPPPPPPAATTGATTTTGGTTTAPAAPGGNGALTAEAKAAATGDVPDNQVFLVLQNPAGGYSIKYPEGWAQRGSGPMVTIQDKNNIVRIEVAKGAAVSPALARADLEKLKRSAPSLQFQAPTTLTLNGKPAVKVVYTTVSAANPVTGKRVKLVVDRYYVAGAGKHAVIDLGTPEGVDNVDAYRLISQSFRWR
jgi:hypothetical protein